MALAVVTRPGLPGRSVALFAVILLGIPTAISVALRLRDVLVGPSTWMHFREAMLENFIFHAGIVGAVLVVLWIAGRGTHRDSFAWRVFGPALGGVVLTIGWLADVSSNGMVSLLESIPAEAGFGLWALNTILCWRWWSIAGATAPQLSNSPVSH